MAELVDGGGLRSAGYVMLAALGVVIARREQHLAPQSSRSVWPTYWWLTAVVLLVMATAHGTHLADLVAGLGRSEARAAGWYEDRRSAQAVVVAAIGGTWLAGVVLAIWRVPPRRRRYLPSAIAVSALLAFAAIRAISLHQIDAVVYDSHLFGVRYVALIELGLLAVAGATMTARLDPTRAVIPMVDARPPRRSPASEA